MNTAFLFFKKTAASFCLLIFSVCYSRVSAQIISTDIQDSTVNTIYSLDLNNDGISDFVIQVGATDKIICFPGSNNAYSGEFVNGRYLSRAMSAPAAICPSMATWYDSIKPGIMAFGTNIGYWAGQTDKYLALKLKVGTNTYYGWVRLDVAPIPISFTIKGYAYEATPNVCVPTGVAVTGVNGQTNKNDIYLFPNPFSTQTILQTNNFLRNATLTVYDCLGQTVKEVKNISGSTVTLFRNNLQSGFYFVRLKENNKVVYKSKIIISD
jgi:Secretion system C-terminal sorting domain